MSKRIIALLLMLALLLSVAGCKKNEDDLGVAETPIAGSDNKQDPDQDSKDPDNNTDDQPDDKQPGNSDSGDSKDPTQPDKTPADKTTTDQPGDNPSKPNNNDNNTNDTLPTSANLTALQKAGTAFTVAAGDTVWFGPMPMTQEDMLTLDGKTVKKADVKEVAKFGGGYRIYSYKAAAAGSMTIQAPQGFENRFLISKGQEMDDVKYNLYWDMMGGTNLYHPSLDSTGKTISWDGKEKNSSDFHLSHAIRITKDETLTFGPCNPAQVVLAYGYDANGKATTLLNGSNLKQNATFAKGMSVYTFTNTENVAWIRLLVPNDVKNDMLVMKNQVFDVAAMNLNPNTYKDPLKGATALFVGDSICEGWKNGNTKIPRFPDAYAGLIAKDTGIEATNAGVGSSTLSNEKPVYNQFEKLQTKDYDYVVIQGGINDMSHNNPVGTMSDSFDIDSFEVTTYAGGLEYTIYKAIEYYGDTAAIAYIFTPAFPNHPSGNYGNLPKFLSVAKDICEKWGVTFLDMNEIQPLIQRLDVNNKTCTSDFIHINAEGYKMVAPYISDMMRTAHACKPDILAKVQK